MKRRTFIYSGIAVVTGLGIATFYLWNNESKWKKQPLLYPFILSGFLNDELLRVIGSSYRVLTPNENSREKLLNLISNGVVRNQNILNNFSDKVIELELKVEQDFKSEKLLILNGWVISQTEARQCALLSLS